MNANPNPKDAELAKLLEASADEINPNPVFLAQLEDQLKAAHKPAARRTPPDMRTMFTVVGWAGALVALALVMNWAIRHLAPNPPQPASGNTPAKLTPTPKPSILQAANGTPVGKAYDWRGITLYLQAPLPAAPTEASVYLYQLEQRATLESARALAAQLGMNGQVYQTDGEIPGTKDFLIVDGSQRLHVRSDQYFQYYPDYPRYVATINGAPHPPDAEAQIEQFLAAHSFDFPHRILPSELYGDIFVQPLTPDGRAICYEYFKCAGLHFALDQQGILFVDGALPKYEPIGQYGIISAEEALQKILNPAAMYDPAAITGMMEGMSSSSGVISTWLRARPTDQTLTLYGYLYSIPALEGGAPLVTLDGYTVTGNTSNIPASMPDTFVEATGQIHEENGVKTFALETWKTCDGCEDGLLGTIDRQGNQIILTTIDNETLILPDIPSDLPLPLKGAFVIGVRDGETFEWKSIDLRNSQGGGGGGGGGLGFYKLNLTGTPVSFPTSGPTPQFGGGSGGGGGDGGGGGGGDGGGEQIYVVQAGDTLTKIASQFGVSVDALAQANGISDPSMLTIGQTLVVPGAAQSGPQKVEGLRGLLSITFYKNANGSQSAEYGFILDTDPHPYLLLQGANLEALQAYQNRPVDVWGTVDAVTGGASRLNVERYEIPFPDLQFQILRGKQKVVTLEGQPATLFTTDDGQTYVQFSSVGGVDSSTSTVGNAGDEVLLEALIVPSETFGGYPALRVFNASMAISPKNGQPVEMQVTSDQIPVVEVPAVTTNTQPVTATIDRVELVYYMPDPRYITTPLEMDQRYLQPAWLFTGHYSDGREFFILIQALKQEFLLPEIAPYTQPG